jgi:hypothetical protein
MTNDVVLFEFTSSTEEISVLFADRVVFLAARRQHHSPKHRKMSAAGWLGLERAGPNPVPLCGNFYRTTGIRTLQIENSLNRALTRRSKAFWT